MKAQRLPGNPIITADTPGLDAETSGNINGPSLIQAPPWLDKPLARYYLYFAHHNGNHIRLALADDLAGPWRVHAGGTLQLSQTSFSHHIASPDVHLDHDHQRVVMYYHGCCNKDPVIRWPQYTCVATSPDGLAFTSATEPLCQSYLRIFTWRGGHYGLAMPGELYRSDDGLTAFRPRAGKLDALTRARRDEDRTRMARHFALALRDDTLDVYFSRIGDCPERILHASIHLDDDWLRWRPTEPTTLLEPEHAWEGADQPLTPSRPAKSVKPVRQLRDPAVYEEAGRTYLLYSVAGEMGIAIAELTP